MRQIVCNVFFLYDISLWSNLGLLMSHNGCNNNYRYHKYVYNLIGFSHSIAIVLLRHTFSVKNNFNINKLELQ